MSTQTKKAIVVLANEGKKMNILGHTATVKLGQAETNGEYYVFEVVTPPGHGIPPHVHQYEDEVIEVVEGEYEILLGENVYQAQPGDILHFPRFIPHGFRNVSAKAGKTLWTVMPGASFEQFFDELGALPANQPPDMGKVVAIFAKYGMEVLPQPVAS
jgi:quercetin dioxygenase-like cupin family protein